MPVPRSASHLAGPDRRAVTKAGLVLDPADIRSFSKGPLMAQCDCRTDFGVSRLIQPDTALTEKIAAFGGELKA